jgi:hypothetical protein
VQVDVVRSANIQWGGGVVQFARWLETLSPTRSDVGLASFEGYRMPLGVRDGRPLISENWLTTIAIMFFSWYRFSCL